MNLTPREKDMARAGDFAYFDGVLLQIFDISDPLAPTLAHLDRALRAALRAAIFGLGRLQPLVDNPALSDIGFDNPVVILISAFNLHYELPAPHGAIRLPSGEKRGCPAMPAIVATVCGVAPPSTASAGRERYWPGTGVCGLRLRLRCWRSWRAFSRSALRASLICLSRSSPSRPRTAVSV